MCLIFTFWLSNETLLPMKLFVNYGIHLCSYIWIRQLPRKQFIGCLRAILCLNNAWVYQALLYYIQEADPKRALVLSHTTLTWDGVLNSVADLCQTFIQPCLWQTPGISHTQHLQLHMHTHTHTVGEFTLYYVPLWV